MGYKTIQDHIWGLIVNYAQTFLSLFIFYKFLTYKELNSKASYN